MNPDLFTPPDPVLDGIPPALTAEELLLPVLSIRQPWASLIAGGWKDIENRDWPTKFRGRFLIHASKGCTREEYRDAAAFAWRIIPSVAIDPLSDIPRGGIVGIATMTHCVTGSSSPWFTGTYGFLLINAARRQFHPCPGTLGFFRLPRPHNLFDAIP